MFLFVYNVVFMVMNIITEIIIYCMLFPVFHYFCTFKSQNINIVQIVVHFLIGTFTGSINYTAYLVKEINSL